MKSFRTTLFFWALFSLVGFQAQASGRIEFILDVSGSMNALAGGDKKIGAAKEAIQKTVQAIPEGSVVALRMYGHRIPNQQKAQSCVDSELLIPFGPVNKVQFLAALSKAVPLGQTPIAYSLQEAAKDFGGLGDEETAIILVSDGAETCGGDPVATAKELLAKGFKVRIHTIGFDVDAATRAQLEAVSQATGGLYLDAKNTAALTDSLQQLTQKSLVLQKEKSVYGGEIRGGDAYESAVPLPPGELFRLDHHQKKNDYDYFYVDLKGGQKLIATFQTGENGVSISETGEVQVNQNPYAGLQVHNANRQKIVSDIIIGSRNAKKVMSISLAQGQEGRFYILVGNNYDHQHKDNPFQIKVVDLFDAGTQQDAGDQASAALPIQEGQYKNYLYPGDTVDMFRFSAAPGETYELKARPSNQEVKLRMTLADADGVQLRQAEAPNNGAAVKVDDFQSPQGGEIFVRINSYWSNSPESEYDLLLARVGASETLPANPTPAAVPPRPSTAQDPKATPAVPTKPKDHVPPHMGVTTTEELQMLLYGMPLWPRIKWFAIYGGTPLLIGWLIGMIWGYVKGRKAGRKKAEEKSISA